MVEPHGVDTAAWRQRFTEARRRSSGWRDPDA
jgi:hypothetical protein